MLLIYNSRAGKGSFLTRLPEVIDMFVKGGYRVEVYPTQAAGDAVEKVSQIPGYISLIVAAGGDGTIDEVVTGLLKSGRDVPLGYIPVGSTNDYAASLKLSFNVLEAVGDILGGEPQAVDMGEFNNEIFVYVAAFGAFTDVSYRTSQESKNMLGHLAYLLEGMKALPSLKGWQMSYKSKERSGEGEFLYGMITNSNSVGGFGGITGRDVTLNDGVFEVTLIRMPAILAVEAPGILTALLNGGENKNVVTFKTSKLEVWFDEDVSWTRDGEYGGDHRHLVIENLPKALSIIVPDPEKEHPLPQRENAQLNDSLRQLSI